MLIAVALAAAAQARAGSAPFVYEQDRLYVPVSAASGRPLGQFILDTGSAKTLVDSRLQSRLALRARSSRREQGAGRGKFDVAMSGPVELRTGNVPVRADSAEIGRINDLLEPYVGRRIGGILGGDLFRKRIVTIDFRRNRISVQKAAGFSYRGNGYKLGFKLVNGVPIARGVIEPGDGTTIRLRLLIDLGAKANLLLAGPFVARYRLAARLGRTVVEPLGAGLGGETRYAFARLVRLRIGDGDISAAGLVIGMSVGNSLRGEGYDGLLGARFLRRFRIVFDYSRSEMFLEPSAGLPSDGFDRSGAFIVTAGDDLHRFIVDDVVSGSPADGAGLRKKDVILELNGCSARQVTLSDVRKMLASPGRAVARLKILRAPSVIHLRIPLKNLL